MPYVLRRSFFGIKEMMEKLIVSNLAFPLNILKQPLEGIFNFFSSIL